MDRHAQTTPPPAAARQPARAPSAALRRAAGVAALLGLTALMGCAQSDYGAVYREYSLQMASQGLFRQEVAPADAPYGELDLFRNFMKVAFVPEAQLLRFYEDRGDTARRLSKWRGPIRYRLTGDGVRAADRISVAEIASDLGRHSGLAIGPVGPDETPNVMIIVMSAAARARLHEAERGAEWYETSLVRDWAKTPNPPCFALFDAGASAGGQIQSASLFLKAELDEPLRRACFVEEFSQALGLVFDHDDVRPSIFNDDQEFIALTDHDRELIEILYDDRLAPGMTAAEAAPVVRRIIGERSRRAG